MLICRLVHVLSSGCLADQRQEESRFLPLTASRPKCSPSMSNWATISTGSLCTILLVFHHPPPTSFSRLFHRPPQLPPLLHLGNEATQVNLSRHRGRVRDRRPAPH